MKPGPARGEAASIEVTVTPAMSARVGDATIHPVYGTTAMVQHVEQVCRALLVPHLEEGEEGVGFRIELLHRAPAPIGATVVLTATVANSSRNEVVCEVTVRHGTTMIARGSFEQRVVNLKEFRASLPAPVEQA